MLSRRLVWFALHEAFPSKNQVVARLSATSGSLGQLFDLACPSTPPPAPPRPLSSWIWLPEHFAVVCTQTTQHACPAPGYANTHHIPTWSIETCPTPRHGPVLLQRFSTSEYATNTVGGLYFIYPCSKLSKSCKKRRHRSSNRNECLRHR